MMLKKKALSLAVAGAIGVPAAAFAESSNVEVYGRLYPEFTVLSGSGATAAGTTGLSTLARTPTGLNVKSRNSVDASNSRIGFRGTEDLGSGLSAIWQIENQVALDSGASNPLAARESFVGLRGGFGTVRLGNMDTVYKRLGDPIRFMGIASGNHVSDSNIISSRMPFGNSSAGSFHLREANSLWYQTPNLGGTTLYAQYSPDTNESATPTTTTKREFWSLGARYRRGPLYLALAHEIHKDFFGGSNGAPSALSNVGNANAHSNDTSTRLTGMWTYSSAGRVSLDVANFDYSESGGLAGRFENYKNKRWAVTWEQRWGSAWRTAAAYANSSAGSCGLVGGATCTTDGLNGNMLALGGEYSFSKRTALFALYSRLNNGESSSYRNAENVSPYETGMDVTQYSLGIRQDF
ncbi:MAG: porin [Burkholderiales bacterium]